MTTKLHSPSERLEILLQKAPEALLGPDAQHWELMTDQDFPESVLSELPTGALIFAGNGVGDYLFIATGIPGVMIFFHEGPRIENYCTKLEELLPDYEHPVSECLPVTYWKSGETVEIGDVVEIRLWVVFKRRGRVVYVPGISPRKPHMERDGLAWVGIRLTSGSLVETIVLPEGNELQKSVRLLERVAG